jgi:arginine decarboxylase
MKNEWDVDAAIATYNVDGWGGGYFTVNPTGNVVVRPLQENGGTIDILEVVNEARNRGLSFPLVIRFQDLLRHRVESVNRAFQEAITEFGYKNEYRGVFPIILVSRPEVSRNWSPRWRCTRIPKVSLFAMATKTQRSSASRC